MSWLAFSRGSAVCALTIPYIEQQTTAQTMSDVIAALLRATAEISDVLQFGAAARSD